MAPGAPVAGSIENKLESRARMGARHARDATRTCFWSSVPKRKRCRSRTDCSRASEPNPTTLRKARKQGGAVASSQRRRDAAETRSSMKAAGVPVRGRRGGTSTPTGTAAGTAAPRPLPLPAAAGGGGGPAAAAPTAGGAAAAPAAAVPEPGRRSHKSHEDPPENAGLGCLARRGMRPGSGRTSRRQGCHSAPGSARRPRGGRSKGR